uniref:Uncharacterized protein n=1 Tax=viral metagenome TaxID=1070528 RepID=A0A6M3INY1_9ZZZZ
MKYTAKLDCLSDKSYSERILTDEAKQQLREQLLNIPVCFGDVCLGKVESVDGDIVTLDLITAMSIDMTADIDMDRNITRILSVPSISFSIGKDADEQHI